jgi:hypothetical protein
LQSAGDDGSPKEDDEARRARRHAARKAAEAQRALVLGSETVGLSSRTRVRRDSQQADAAEVPRRAGILSKVAEIDRAREETDLAREHRDAQKSASKQPKSKHEAFASKLAAVDGEDDDPIIAAIGEASRTKGRSSTSGSAARRRHH